MGEERSIVEEGGGCTCGRVSDFGEQIEKRGQVDFEITQPAFIASSIGQFASVTCVAVDRLPINPVIYISSTSLKRRPM